MQSQPAFDTHAFVKRLTRAGMPEDQAEILANGQSDLRMTLRSSRLNSRTTLTKSRPTLSRSRPS